MNMFARRILMFFAVAAVALVIAFALFHDAVYRWAALRALDYATGIDAAIDGEFKVAHGSPMLLHRSAASGASSSAAAARSGADQESRSS
jgi:hypothetical protein